jgi:uncharacterized GH25 family protein
MREASSHYVGHYVGHYVALFAALLLFAASTIAAAHEFWVEPSTFSPATGARLDVRLCVGDGFEGWALARNDQRLERFGVIGRSGEQPLLGIDGADPAGIARLQTSGGHIIAFESKHSLANMPADQFSAYLKEKGLEQILMLRERRGESLRGTRDAYSRHAKALIRVGESQDKIVDRAIGLRLELIAEFDRPGPERNFRLLYEGKPLANALVTATLLGAAASDLHARTDNHGRATFSLQAAGPWRIAAVHMIEARDSVASDWESLWASLTFELSAPESIPQTDAARGAVCRNRAVLSAAKVQQ